MRNIMIRKKTLVWLAVAVCIAMAAGFSLPTACFAEESAAGSGGLGNESEGTFKMIKDPPEFEAGKDIKSGRIEKFFDATGTVNRIDDKSIILGDRWFEIADGVRFAGIKSGDHVGLRLNKKREVVDFEKLKDVPH